MHQRSDCTKWRRVTQNGGYSERKIIQRKFPRERERERKKEEKENWDPVGHIGCPHLSKWQNPSFATLCSSKKVTKCSEKAVKWKTANEQKAITSKHKVSKEGGDQAGRASCVAHGHGHCHWGTHIISPVLCAHDASAQLGDTYSIYPGQLRPSRPVLGCATITKFATSTLFFFLF